MSIISCPSCGNSVSSEALVCPSCKSKISNEKSDGTQSNGGGFIPSYPINNSSFNIPSIGEWMLYFLVLSIPLVNLIVLIIWALDGNNMIRKNFSAAALIWILILTFITFLIWTAIFSAIA